jgi:FAD/FMN-containing dehydrogenase
MGKEVLHRLIEVLGREAVIERDFHARYLRDGLRQHRGFCMPKKYIPEVVVLPQTTTQVAEIVKIANVFKTSVVASGGRTGLMGGALCDGGILIDLCRMNKLIDVNKEDKTATVQAGMTLLELQNELDKYGLILGHDPWSSPRATIGGAISTNGVGYLAQKYGCMGDMVLGVKVVLPDGQIIQTRPSRKRSVGFEPKNIFIGSEGTLGIITEATIRLFPKPEARVIKALEFPSFDDGFYAVVEMFDKQLYPSLLDFSDPNKNISYILHEFFDRAPTMYLAFEGVKEVAQIEMKKAIEICINYHASILPEEKAQKFWQNRYEPVFLYDIDKEGKSKIDEVMQGIKFDYIHCYLPSSKIIEYRNRATEIFTKYDIAVVESSIWTCPEFFNMLIARFVEDGDYDNKRFQDAIDDAYKLAHLLNGSIEFCHGIGIRLSHLLKSEHDSSLVVYRKIKGALDSQSILNKKIWLLT